MPNSYTVELWIDRSGPSQFAVNYLIDAHKDPLTGEQHVYTTWAFKLSTLSGSPIDSNKGAGAGAGFGFLNYALDSKAGIQSYKLDFKAYNDVSRKGLDLNWTLSDGALEKADLSIAGTGGADLILGGFGADYIRSSRGDDLIDAGGGDDVVSAGSGADQLDGGEGDDILIGGEGDDRYIVDSRDDLIVEKSGQGLDSVISTVSFTLADHVETLFLRGFSSIDGTGNSQANLIYGNGGANVLDGRAGADVMTGYGGSDTFHVDDAGDRTIEASVRGSDTDTVVTSVSYALTVGQEIEVLQTIDAASRAALHLTGNAFAQRLVGNDGANILNGGWGNDVLTGRGGADTFAFDTKLGAGNVDRITDFSVPADTIRLENAIFTALAAGKLGSHSFKDLGVAGARLDGDDRIVYDRSTGALSYDADGSGTKASLVQFATIDTKAVLTAADFLIV